MRSWAAVLGISLVACGGHEIAAIDGNSDAPVDASADAMLDAPPDATPEIGRRITGTALGVRGPSFVVLDSPSRRQLVPITEDGPFAFPHLVPDQTTLTFSVMPFAPQT